MRLRHKKGAEEDILRSPFCIHIEETSEGCDLASFFKKNQPIYLELGMGKGKFICEMAKKYNYINFIGIEKYATVVLKAIENYKRYFDILSPCPQDVSKTLTNQIGNTNLRFMCEDVSHLDMMIKPHSIDKIYLNFSDPWPKKRHENRRLTHHDFLSIYEKLLKANGTIEFKTDNVGLFDFSLEEIKLSNFKIVYKTYDLHHDKELMIDNVETEYEHKFSSKGNPICKYKAYK